MAGSWNPNIKFIQDGERVDATISGRPDRALGDRTQYLKDRVDAIDNGQALFSFDVAVESSVVVGQAVYWNATTQQFEKALAATTTDSSGVFVNSPSSDVIGVVYSKTSATIATLITYGTVALSLANSVDGAVEAGRYYLSGSQAGYLAKQVPGITIPVLIADGNGNIYVQIQPREITETHQHYKVELYMRAAGVAAVQTVHGESRAVVTSPDTDLPGWLPAADASFNGLAPPKAAFGYNLSQHPELSKLWPPIPEGNASLTVFTNLSGALSNLGLEVPIGPDGLVIIDRHGLWWMSDCNGEAPWQSYYNSSVSLSSTGSIGYPECPRNAESKLILYFAKAKYGSGSSVVNTLQANSVDSPIIITDLDGNSANSGNLKIAFDSSFMVTTQTDQGSLVLKQLNSNNFTRGRVVEGIKATNGSVTITSTESRLDGSATLHQGIVSIEANIEGVERFIAPQVVRVINCRERYEEDIMYLGFPAAVQSSVRYKFKLPGSDGFPNNAKLSLRLWLTGDASTASFPTMTVSYRRLPRPTTATALPLTDTYLTFTTGMALGTNEYIEKTSAIFSVYESDEVLFTISRSSSDGYLGEIGIVDAVAVLSPGT